MLSENHTGEGADHQKAEKMATKGISVQSSRFALLQIDDDDSDEEQTKSVKQAQNKPGNAQTGQTKKKNKKKKKEATENAQVGFV